MTVPERSSSGALTFLKLSVEKLSTRAVLAGVEGQVEVGAVGTGGAGSSIEDRGGDGAPLALLNGGQKDVVGGAEDAHSGVVVEVLGKVAGNAGVVGREVGVGGRTDA